MIRLAPTAPRETTEDTVVLSSGDIRIPIHDASVEPSRPDYADQRYPGVTGERALREAVAEYATTGGGASITPDHVIIAPGARLAILACLGSVVGVRREVLLPAPYWSSYPELIRFVGGAPIVVPGRVGDGRIDGATLEPFRTPQTAAVIVNSPRNPDGAVTPRAAMAETVDWAARHGVVVLFDQVYRGVSPFGGPPTSLLELGPTLPAHCIVADGLTKSHALAGLRIGWAVAGGELRDGMAAVASHLFGGVCSLAQRVAARILTDGRDVRGLVSAAVARNIEYALETLAAVPGVRCARPQAGFFLCVDLGGWLAARAPAEARADVTRWLAARHGVAVVDGAVFGAPGHVRLSAAVPPDQLAEGLRRLTRALSVPSAGALHLEDSRR